MSFRFLTAGESHGKGLMGILEGIPSGLSLEASFIQKQLKRRKLGWGRGARQKIETDEVEIISGVRLGKTLGSPICLWIKNQDWQVWQEIMKVEHDSVPPKRQVHVPRPGHADFVGGIKYAHSDMRNVLERSSARETAIRVGIGSVARRFLEELDISIGSRVTQIGVYGDSESFQGKVSALNDQADLSLVRCLSPEASATMVQEISRAQKDGDTLGGCFEVLAEGIPVGLGSYTHWDRRLEGKIAQAFMSLNAVKGVEIGLGFQLAKLPGSQAHDELGLKDTKVIYKKNNAGGIEGGMSTGQVLSVRAGMKPLSTLMSPLHSVNLLKKVEEPAHIERSDVCAVPAAAVIAESLLALVLSEAILEKFGGDSLEEVRTRVFRWNHEYI